MKAVVLLCVVLGLVAVVSGTTYNVDSGMSYSTILDTIHGLVAGDTLILANGTYTGVDLKIEQSNNGAGLQGGSSLPITIQGSGDTNIVADTTNFQECVLLPQGAQYIVIKNIICTHTSSGTVTTQGGIWIDQNVDNIKIVGCYVHDVTGTGIQLNKNNVHDITIEDNTIYNTGLNLADSQNGGYGIWAGGLDISSATTGVYNIIVKHNHIYQTNGQEGSCVRLFYGVLSSQVLDNVLHDCPRGNGGQQETYALIVIGNGPQAGNTADINHVQRNVIYNIAGTGNQRNIGIYASAGTQIINNLVIGADYGIAVRREGANQYDNTAVIHNTVFGIRDSSSYLAFSISDGTTSDSSSFIIRNNVFSVGSGTSAFGYRFGTRSASAVISNNRFDGQSYQELDEATEMKALGAFTSAFVNPTTTVPGADLMCAGVLVDDGVDAGVSLDFDNNNRPQGSAVDVGCYEAGSGPNAHWAIQAALKGSSGSVGPCVGCNNNVGSSSASTIVNPWAVREL